MKILHKTPQPEIKIYDYDAPFFPVITLSPEASDNTQLLSYSFSESVKDLTGSFDFSIAGGDNNLFNEIQPLHIVKIYEGSSMPAFVGIVTTRSLSCSMTESGVRRTVNFSGKSITSLLAEFQLILDIKFLKTLNVQDAEKISRDLKIKILELQSNENLTIQKFLELTWKTYLEFTGITKATESGKQPASNTTVYRIIELFMGNNFFEGMTGATLPIPIANSFFNQDINTVLQIWQTILAPPVYEIFSRVDDYGLPKVVVREAPFDAADWKQLQEKKYSVQSWELTNYSLHLSNDEVYTAFFGYLEGSELSAEQYQIIESGDDAKRDGGILQTAKDKFDIYGLKLCQVAFRGYNRGHQTPEKTGKAMKDLSKRLRAWFSRLDEMYSGSITIANQFNGQYPKCGEVVGFLGGEFYVQRSDHSWSYGGAPTISMQVVRGGVYDGDGKFIKTLPDMGKTRIELQHDMQLDTQALPLLSFNR